MAPGPQPPGKDCLVVAAAGYGKSTWLTSLAADAGGRYVTAAELAADDCAAVGELPSRLGLLAVDDLDRLPAGAETGRCGPRPVTRGQRPGAARGARRHRCRRGRPGAPAPDPDQAGSGP